MIYWKTKI